MKLLLVDDNTSITTMLSKYLTLKGHNCTVLNDSKEALNQIKKGDFDVVLLDLAMPVFSGRDLISSLVADGTIKDHKIIIISAIPISDSEILEFQKKGILAFLNKPVELDELSQKLASVS